MRTIAILGSTGSIGTQALDIISANPDEFSVAGLTAHSNIGKLKEQIDAFKPKAVAVMEREKAEVLAEEIDYAVPVLAGLAGIHSIATMQETDAVINSLVGSVGVTPTLKALDAGKRVCLANKETLVAAGGIVMQKAQQREAELLPIDSEHSAIFQCMRGVDDGEVRKLILTCSGGAFRDKSIGEMRSLTAKDALMHPTWKMGSKITIDSATLMNKGFEVIEAHHLFGMAYDAIEVVKHPQSIIHSLIELNDNAVLAQLGWPDMRIPIQYALSYPDRIPSSARPFSLIDVKQLTFGEIDAKRFPCLGYALLAGKAGGTMPAVLNAANEVAVHAFLNDEISFPDISRMVKEALDSHTLIRRPDIDEILEVDMRVKNEVRNTISEQ